MLWYAAEAHFEKNRKMRRLRAALDWTDDQLIARMHRLFSAVREQAPDGNLCDFTDEDLALAMGLEPGEGERLFRGMVEAGLLEREGQDWHLHGWMERNGRFMRDAARQRQRREQVKQRKQIADESADAQRTSAEHPRGAGAGAGAGPTTGSPPQPSVATESAAPSRDGIGLVRTLADLLGGKAPAKAAVITHDDVHAFAGRLPSAQQRVAHQLLNRLKRQAPDTRADVLLAILRHYAEHHEAIGNPYAYYQPGSEGFLYAERHARLLIEEREHQQLKRGERALLAREDP